MQLESSASPLRPRSSARTLRGLTLALAALAIVGLGCVVIPVPADKDLTAETVYRPKAEKGDPVAALQLALAYRFGTAGAMQDDKAAWRWLNRAAELGNSEARVMLAETLWRGDLGQTRQPAAALAALTQLASSGSRDQQALLASWLEGDLGGDPQPAEAALWYEKAARRGHRFAAQRLGQLLEQGRGLRQDKIMAAAWYRVADARSDLSRLEATLSAPERSRASQQAAALQREIRP